MASLKQHSARKIMPDHPSALLKAFEGSMMKERSGGKVILRS
jgi:hypothetical protein